MKEFESSTRKPNCVFPLLSCLTVIMMIYATSGYTLPAMGRWLDVGERPDRRDFVMLLNGDPDTRPFAVVDLYRRGKAGRVLITSVNDSGLTLGPRIHEITRAILVRCGVPESRIDFLDSRCDNTFEEAQALEQFMKRHPDVTFSVVTSTYHTRRSRWVFRKVLGSETSRVRFVSAPTDAFNATNWWKHEEGFILYLAEFLKLFFYLMRYGHGLIWISAIVGLTGMGWWLRDRGFKASVVQ